MNILQKPPPFQILKPVTSPTATMEENAKALVAQYKIVKEMIKRAKPFRPKDPKEPSSSKASASQEDDRLGSKTDGVMLLKTAQNIYIYELLLLQSIVPIPLNLIYVSQSSQHSQHQPLFGKDRRCLYERRFIQTEKKDSFRLELEDGRWFAFELKENGEFKDKGNLGVRIERLGEEHYTLHYHNGESQEYKNSYLTKITNIHQQNLYLQYNKINQLISISNEYEVEIYFSYTTSNQISKMQDHSQRVWRFTYNAQGYLTRISQDSKTLQQYIYSKPLLQLIEIKDALNQTNKIFIYNKDFKALASNKPYKNKDNVPFKIGKLDRPSDSILELLNDNNFKKEYKYIFSDDLKVLIYNKQKMTLSTWGQSEIASTICVGGNKILFEIDKDILKVYFLDYAGGEIAK